MRYNEERPGTGKEYRPYGKPGERKGSYGKPGDRQGSYGKPGDRQGSYGKPGDRQGSYGKPGEKAEPYEKKPYRFGTAAQNKGQEPRRPRPVKTSEPAPNAEQDELPFLIFGRNSVREAIRAGRSIDKILVNKEQDGSLREILDAAHERKLVVHETAREKLDEVCMPFGHGGRTANHQGIVAYMAGVEYCDIEDILAEAREKQEPPFVVVLDGIEDPHNLGSILRSADLAGAHGVIIGKRRSASVTAAAVKASAGAAEHIRIARVVNIPAAVEILKKEGLWAVGADMDGESVYTKDITGALALIIGSEGEGISHLVKEKCDFLVSIPMHGHIDSLNAGVAAGILMFEKSRQESLKD